MNKRDLIDSIAIGAKLTRAQAARALESFVAGVHTSLVRGDRVTISGFGTFDVSQRKARRVRNPRNGSSMEVRARRVPRFAPAPYLKSAVEDSRPALSAETDPRGESCRPRKAS